MKNNSIQDDIIDRAADSLAREIDREVLWDMLAQMGWVRVMLPTLQSNMQAVDISNWIAEHCHKGCEQNGRDFIFQDEREAMWFKLRWLS
jgi:hypothetical protein